MVVKESQPTAPQPAVQAGNGLPGPISNPAATTGNLRPNTQPVKPLVDKSKHKPRKTEREAIAQVASTRAGYRLSDEALKPQSEPPQPAAAALGRQRRAEEARQRELASRKRLSRILLAGGILLLLIAAVIVGTLVYQYLNARSSYEQITAASGMDVTNDQGIVSTEITSNDMVFDWEALRTINPDIVAWVLIPGTHVNYPIVQGPDNEYYLTHLFDSSGSGVGAVFLDFEGSSTLDAANNMVYGHNMMDGSMFADITHFTDQAYFDEHRTIYVCTPAATFELRTFAVETVSEQMPLRIFNFANADDYVGYINELVSLASIAADDVDPASITNVYSFVTCHGADNTLRIIVNASLVSQTPVQGAQTQ